MKTLLVIILLAVSACAHTPVMRTATIPGGGACYRSFRPALAAWEARFGRVPESCAYLDAEYSIALRPASQLPCAKPRPGEIVTGCTIHPPPSIYLLDGRTNVELVDTSVHEWMHTESLCVFGDIDESHSRAGLWALDGAGDVTKSVEIQAQASARIGPCL